MPTTLRLLGWTAKGFRCPDHQVSFLKSTDTVYSVSLIQMPNGTGKTTTLDLLRATLAGNASAWSPDQVRLFRKQSNASSGEFQVSLLQDGQRRLTITLDFDFDEGKVRYRTTIGRGREEGFHPPRELSKFLRPEFIRFFIFDGELAEHLLNSERTDAQTASEALFELTLLDHIKSAVEEHWEQQTKNSSAKESKGYSRRQNRHEKLKERLHTLTIARDKLKADRVWLAKEHKRKDRKFSDAISQQKEYRERLSMAETALSTSNAAVVKVTKDLLTRMRDPHALGSQWARELLAFKDSLDRVKLPESAAREFFQELANEDHCVCGRAFDDLSRQALRERATHYLGSDNVALLNGLKNDITELVGPDTARHHEELQSLCNRLTEVAHDEDLSRVERDQIRNDASKDDPELEKAKEELSDLYRRLTECEFALRTYSDGTDSDDSNDISVITSRLAQAEKDLSEIAKTIGLGDRKNTLGTILTKAKELALKAISKTVCNDANTRIARMMPDNAIRIQDIRSSLILKGQESGSVGENLTVAYSFLSTLFNRSEHQLPFIVDSPANPIDLAVRSEVGRMIPQLTKQFVAFTISSERENFIPALEEACSSDIQYLTLFRKGNKELERTASKESGTVATQDGLCIPGREYFHSFHKDKE